MRSGWEEGVGSRITFVVVVDILPDVVAAVSSVAGGRSNEGDL